MKSTDPKIQALILALSSIGKIGPVKIKMLLAMVANPLDLFDWDREEFCKVPGISSTLADYIVSKLNPEKGYKILEWAEKHAYSVLTLADADYPKSLKKIYDPPPFIFLNGNIIEEDIRSIAIVGARTASEYGRTMAHKIARELTSHGITVVSGMAVGVDSSAHRGALVAGGRTLAVLGSGIDVVYPRTNKKLYEEISQQGSVLSEFLPGVGPNPPHFPRRNRVISGLSQGIIVVEAGQKSGALLTADLALSQGKKLFAVPGQLTSKMSAGTNELIKSGAHLLSSIDDIFSVLPELKSDYIVPQRRAEADLTEGENLMFSRLSDEPKQLDELVRECRLSVSDTATYLLSLELRGLVKQLSGKRFITV
ncbi:MAG: DNA-processing protein DprA [candidate division Zixibacteria bacterium]|nr:DNA-processing protein DprA [candidate division Zixibacteria bacterium]